MKLFRCRRCNGLVAVESPAELTGNCEQCNFEPRGCSLDTRKVWEQVEPARFQGVIP